MPKKPAIDYKEVADILRKKLEQDDILSMPLFPSSQKPLHGYLDTVLSKDALIDLLAYRLVSKPRFEVVRYLTFPEVGANIIWNLLMTALVVGRIIDHWRTTQQLSDDYGMSIIFGDDNSIKFFKCVYFKNGEKNEFSMAAEATNISDNWKRSFVLVESTGDRHAASWVLLEKLRKNVDEFYSAWKTVHF